MSVTYTSYVPDGRRMYEYEAGPCEWPMIRGQLCFLCHKEIEPPAIMWMGCESNHQGGELWLHPDCFPKLVQRLYRDYDEVRSKNDPSYRAIVAVGVIE